MTPSFGGHLLVLDEEAGWLQAESQGRRMHSRLSENAGVIKRRLDLAQPSPPPLDKTRGTLLEISGHRKRTRLGLSLNNPR